MGHDSCSLPFFDLHLQKETNFAMMLWEFPYFAPLPFPAGGKSLSVFRSVTPDNRGQGTDPVRPVCTRVVTTSWTFTGQVSGEPRCSSLTMQIWCEPMGYWLLRNKTNCRVCGWNQSVAVIFALLPDGCCLIVSQTPHSWHFSSGRVTFLFFREKTL